MSAINIDGVTLRDYLAASLPREPIPESVGVALCGPKPTHPDPLVTMEWWSHVEAAWRYNKADAMLKVRLKVPPQRSR